MTRHDPMRLFIWLLVVVALFAGVATLAAGLAFGQENPTVMMPSKET